MRSKTFPVLVTASAIAILMIMSSSVWGKDYERRFIKNYPPGYYGMWYYAERFFNSNDPNDKTQEKYRWDRFMSATANMSYPYYPIPFAWDYGNTEKFNLPDYNANDWP